MDIGVNLPQDPSEWTPKDERDFHLNATVATLILQCLTPEDNNKVNGMVNAKQIWDTLKVSFEGDKSVRVGNIELLQSKIENFCILEGETTKAMFGRFMSLINQIRALGAKHGMITLQQERFVECIDKGTTCLHPSSWRKTTITL